MAGDFGTPGGTGKRLPAAKVIFHLDDGKGKDLDLSIMTACQGLSERVASARLAFVLIGFAPGLKGTASGQVKSLLPSPIL